MTKLYKFFKNRNQIEIKKKLETNFTILDKKRDQRVIKPKYFYSLLYLI